VTAPEESLCQGAATILGRPLTPSEIESIWAYLDLLQSWNRVHRLVGSTDRQWMVDNLVLDSLLFLRVVPTSAVSLIDVGSGAGIPGVPLKIVRPALSVLLAESRRKRASFLSDVVRTVQLTEIAVYHGRAEALIHQGRRFDAVVARCADGVERVLHLGSRLVGAGGLVAVAGPPEQAAALTIGSWRRVVNPVTGRTRSFAVAQA
jgi:16S rRNA (guanine527-N7)-methyltransferase